MEDSRTEAFIEAISGAPPPPDLPARRDPPPPGAGYFEKLARQVEGQPGLDSQAPRESTEARDARRITERLPEGYEPTTATDITFDPRIAYELALAIDKPSAIFAKYGYTEEDAREFIGNDAFMGTVRKYREEILAGGIGFKLRAKIQAEDLLTHSYLIATDPETPAAVRADMIKWTAKVAGFEPQSGDKGGGGAAGSGFTLNIMLAGTLAPVAVEGRVIEGEVITEGS